MITITPYENAHQQGIDDMMAGIAMEYDETIYAPDTKSIKQLSVNSNEKYWVALHGDAVVGTVGIVVISNNIGVMKRMMLSKNYRGKEYGTAALLLQTIINWCNGNNIKDIYLGTMKQFIAAQKFYEKNGFENIAREHLPPGMPLNRVDTIFYHLQLKTAA